MPKTKTFSFAFSFPFPILSLIAFVIPFSLGHSQITTGIFVNTLLYLSSILLPLKKSWFIAFLPAVAILARGFVFGPLTSFLVYFLPFIWLGNLVILLAPKILFLRNKQYITIIISATIKFIFLFAIANLFYSANLVPKLFLTSMGIYQLITALTGGTIAYFILKGVNNKQLQP